MTASTRQRSARRRLQVPLIMLIGGGAITAATAAGHAPIGFTAAEAGITVAFTVIFWWVGRSRGDFGAVFGSRADERQRVVDLRATAVAGVAVAAFCLVATVVSLARGGTGNPWAAMDAIFGAVYVAGLVVFRRTG